MREALINQVTSTGCTIKSAAQKLGINFSTAKAIMQIFKKEGRSCKKVIRKNRKRRTSLGKKHSKYLKDTSIMF
jgi:transposase